MKKFLLSLCVAMLSFVGAWAQSPSVTKSVSADGKTVTYTCVGDVSGLENSVVTGYTFNQAAVTAPVYKENRVGGSTVTNGEQYYSTSAYYTMSYTYSQANINTVDGYVLKQNVYQFDGTATYALKASGTGLAAGGSNFYSLTTAGTAVADMSSYLGGEAFTSKVNEGDGIWKFPEGADTETEGYRATKVSVGDTYDDKCTYTTRQYTNPPVISKSQLLSDGYLGQMVSDAATTIYAVVDGNYTKAAGTVYNASAAYVDGVEFASIADVYTETYTENTTTVSTGSDTYYTLNDGEYVVVEDGSVFTGYQTDYFKRDADPVFPTIPQADLLSMNYLDPVMGTASYWLGVYNEIKANSYENVIFVSDGGDKAVINSNVIRYLLWGSLTDATNVNTAIKKLDLGGVECSDLSGKSWVLLNDDESVRAGERVTYFNIAELTLPLTKATNDDYVVPSYVLQYFCINTNNALKHVLIPHGYTEIADHAFMTTADYGLVNIEEYTIPSDLTIIREKAFYDNGSLKKINVPDHSLTQIWRFAFSGTKLESFDFPASLRFIGAGAFDNVKTLKALDFSSTRLEYIGNSAFYCDEKVVVPSAITFPPTIEYIGPGAFNFREYGDIYFTGEHKAPTCPVGPSVHGLGLESKLGTFGSMDMAAWSGNTHMGYNGFVPNAVDLAGDNANAGYANRENYQNHEVYFTMLHFPAGVTIEEAKTYKDVTRKYVTGRNADGSFSYGGEISCGGLETDDQILHYADHGGSTWPSEPMSRPGFVAPGYEDTYLGAQKVWPSQNQWMRAYTTVANGVEWNGKDEYRPEVDATMLKWMKYDNLQLWDPATNNYVALNGGDYTLNEAAANAYNARLQGAVHVGDAIDYLDTDEKVAAYNAQLPGAVEAGEHNYTEEQAKAHNAGLPGAISTEDIKEPAVEAKDAVYYQDDEKEWVNNVQYVKSTLVWHDAVPAVIYTSWEAYAEANGIEEDGIVAGYYDKNQFEENYNKYINGENGWYFPGTGIEITPAVAAYWEVTADSKVVPSDNIKEPAVEGHPDIYYTQQEVDEYNADPTRNPGAVSTSDTYTLTEEEAIAENAKLPGAKKLNDPWHLYDEASANAHNAELTGAKKNDGEGNYGTDSVEAVFADYLSKIAYQSTRRFVLADDGSKKGQDYPTDVKGHNWWTIVFPFSMTKAEVDEVFGVGTHVCLFSGVDRNATSDTKHITLKFQNDVYAHNTPLEAYKTDDDGSHYAEFSKTAAAPGDDDLVIKAFESYMIYPMKGSQDAADFEIKNPKIEQGAPFPTVIKSNTAVNGNVVADWVDTSDNTEYRFVGNLLTGLVDAESGTVKPNTIPQYSYVYAKKKNDDHYQFWFYTGTTSAWKVNKSVVQATAKDGGISDSKNFFGGDVNGVKQVSLFGADDEETTEIEDITIVVGEGENAAIYNISGQRIAAPQKGLYIKNGKKYIAK